MLTDDEWYELLERQAANIDSIQQRILIRDAAGKSTVFAQSALDDMIREHRAALSRAPLDVLFEFGRESAFGKHS